MVDKIQYIALANDVLAVAVCGEADDWSAYIGAVQGINHDIEKTHVARTGCKLPYEVAKILFPTHAETLKWRD